MLRTALEALCPGGVAAYVTCSPHRAETRAIVNQVLEECDDVELLQAGDMLPEVPACTDGAFVQLWPHRHGTDAMFLALIRRRYTSPHAATHHS